MSEFKEKVIAEKKVGDTTWRVAISTKGSLQLATLRAFNGDKPSKNGFAVKIENAKATLTAVSGLLGTLYTEVDKASVVDGSAVTQMFKLQNASGKFLKRVDEEGKAIVTTEEAKAMQFASLKKVQAFMRTELAKPDSWEIV